MVGIVNECNVVGMMWDSTVKGARITGKNDGERLSAAW